MAPNAIPTYSQPQDVCRARSAIAPCRFAEPQGAFYLFFKVEGEADTRRLAMRLVDDANIGLAPGTALGAGGEPFLRLCFARDGSQLEMARLKAVLTHR